jgi:hypothetical protein
MVMLYNKGVVRTKGVLVARCILKLIDKTDRTGRYTRQFE